MDPATCCVCLSLLCAGLASSQPLPCGEGRHLASGVCELCPLGTYNPNTGRVQTCVICPTDHHGYRATTPTEGATSSDQCVFPPRLTPLTPAYGPVAGGTRLSLHVLHAPPHALPTRVTVADFECLLLEVMDESSVTCSTPDVTEWVTVTANETDVHDGPVVVTYNTSEVLPSAENFTYKVDPLIEGIGPLTTFLSGGVHIAVWGEHLTSVSGPRLLVTRLSTRRTPATYSQACRVVNSTFMICVTPNLTPSLRPTLYAPHPSPHQDITPLDDLTPAAQLPTHLLKELKVKRSLYRKSRAASGVVLNDADTQFYAGVGLDGVTGWRNVSAALPGVGQLLVYPDPLYHHFWEAGHVRHFRPGTDTFLHIKGQHLDYVSEVMDVRVTIGQGTCDVTLLATNQLTCRPPQETPEVELTGYAERDIPRVTVYVGSLTYVVGYLHYSTALPPHLIATGTVLGVLAVAVIVVVMVMWFRRRRCHGDWWGKLDVAAARRDNTYDPRDGYLRPVNLPDGVPPSVPPSTCRPLSEAVSPPGTPSLLGLQPLGAASPPFWTLTPDTPPPGPAPTPFLWERDVDPSLRDALTGCLVDADRLNLLEVIGQGYFGKVYRGELRGDTPASEPTAVAVKTLHGSASPEVTSFLREAMLMRELSHEHVLGLLGVVVRGNRPHVLLPFMDHGDLKSYIRKPSRKLKVRELLDFGRQVACGMAYMAAQKFVHRDLATRNCMLNSDLVLKIADFGLSRDVYSSDYYKMADKHKPLPVKWMAIESLDAGIFSSKTDVWAFGVVLWELLTRGRTPYPDVDSFHLKTYLLCGRRLERPAHVTTELYALMCQCWREAADERPTFPALRDDLTQLLTALTTRSNKEYGLSTNVTP